MSSRFGGPPDSPLDAPPIFPVVGRMNVPGLCCSICKRPLAPADQYVQDNRIVCDRHVRSHSYRTLTAASEAHSEAFDLGEVFVIGGRTGPA